MNIAGEVKLVGDAYAGGFSCGMTMTGNGTMERLKEVSNTEKEVLYQSEDGLELKVMKTFDSKLDVTTVNTIVTNRTNQEVCLEMLSSFCIKDVTADRFHRLQSCWSAEGKLKSESITDLHLEKSWNGCAYRIEKFGNVGSMPVRKYFPFLALEDSKTGHVIGIQLYSASSWQMEIRCRETQAFTVAGGIADRDFGQWMKHLKPGECFEAPKAVLAEGSSLWEICNKLVEAQNPDISEVDNDMGVMFNEYCTTWGNPTIENLKRISDKIAGKGIKYLVIDSGWYGSAKEWWNQIGDWTINTERFPNGLKEAADYIKSKGMIPGLWFEMESVTHESMHFHEADHLVLKDGVPLTVGNRHFWDMENPWVVDFLSEKVIGTLKENGFGYLKVDYNDSMGMGCDGEDGPGENLRKKVEASREFFRKIKREIPQIVIENCSSGGHRLEPSMMELCSQASFSDAHETTAIPLIAANMHRVIKPSQSQIWAVMRASDTDERLFYSICSTFLGRMCLSGDIYDMSKHQWSIIEEGIRFYNEIALIIKNGKTVLVKNRTESYNDPEGEQLVVRMYGNKGLAVFHRFRNSKNVEEILTGNEKEGSIRVIKTYGDANHDFSAKAWLFEINHANQE